MILKPNYYLKFYMWVHSNLDLIELNSNEGSVKRRTLGEKVLMAALQHHRKNQQDIRLEYVHLFQ